MKKYCIAYMNYFDNIMTQEIVEAYFIENALHQALNKAGVILDDDKDFDYSKNEEQLKQLAFDCDCMVSAIELS